MTKPTQPRISALATRSQQHTFTRDWLNAQCALDSQAALLPLTQAASNSNFSDLGTETFSRLNFAAQIESRRVSIAVRFALVVLIPAILFTGITGAMAIIMASQSH